MTVPKASAAMPKWGGLSPVNHWKVVKKLEPSDLIAGIALEIRKTPMATMMSRTDMPAPVDRPRNIDSKLHRFRRGSAPPPPSGGAGLPGPPGGPPRKSFSSMLGGSPDMREGPGGVGGATSAEPANEDWLIRVSSPFVFGTAVLALGLSARAAPARRRPGVEPEASAERRDRGGDLGADRLGERRIPDRGQLVLARGARRV